MAEIKAKMAADPSYNPMSDPQAMQVLDSMIPAEMKEFPNAVERMKVSFADATAGNDAITDLDAAAANETTEKKNLNSAPSSEYFKGGLVDTGSDFDAAKKDEYFNKMRAEHPDVPLEE